MMGKNWSSAEEDVGFIGALLVHFNLQMGQLKRSTGLVSTATTGPQDTKEQFEDSPCLCISGRYSLLKAPRRV